MARKNLAADRFRRVWHMVEDIAREPGKSRRDLASKYSLSERQIQSDLELIRQEMRLPLIRRQGYRFETDTRIPPPSLSFRETQLMVLAVRQLGRERGVQRKELADLLAKLPGLFPPHLRPLADRLLEPVTSPDGGVGIQRDDIFAALSEAAVRKALVRLHYDPGVPTAVIPDPIVRAELIVPVDGSWYIIGHWLQKKRLSMFDLDGVQAVTPTLRD